MSARTMVTAFVTIAVALACVDQPTQAVPPSGAVVILTTPNSDDGAMVITLTGPSIRDLQAVDSSQAFYTRTVNDSEVRVILVGNLSSGALFTFASAASADLSAYRVTLDEVATRSDSLRENLTTYQLSIKGRTLVF